jgi:hypothetical protein
VSTDEGGRPRRTGRGGRFRTREVTLRSSERGEMPPPPHHLDPGEIELFAQLYATPVAKLWQQPFDRALVALLAQVMVRIEDGNLDAWLSARLTSLQAHLFLSPRVRRTAGIHVEDGRARGSRRGRRRAA